MTSSSLEPKMAPSANTLLRAILLIRFLCDARFPYEILRSRLMETGSLLLASKLCAD
jgi:hypothetical protein